jgi:hypothetical protein
MSNIYQEYRDNKYGQELAELQYTIPPNTFDPGYLLNGKTATLKLYEKNLIEFLPNRVGYIDQGVKYPGDIRKVTHFILVPRIEPDDDFRTPFLVVFDPEYVYLYETTSDIRFTGGLRFYFSTRRPDSLTDTAILQVQGIELSASSRDVRLDTVKWYYDVKPLF